MKELFTLSVVLLVSTPGMILLVRAYDPPMWACFLLGIPLGLIGNIIGSIIWDICIGKNKKGESI